MAEGSDSEFQCEIKFCVLFCFVFSSSSYNVRTTQQIVVEMLGSPGMPFSPGDLVAVK